MTDKIQKSLAKLTEKERKQVKQTLLRLKANELAGLNINKLKDHTDIYRVRRADIRIIYKQDSESIKILAIERRSEKTYRDF